MIAEEEIFGLERCIGVAESHNCDSFILFDEVSCAAIDENFPGVGRAFEDVSFEACAGGD